MQAALVEKVIDKATPSMDVAQLARTWMDLERFKREVRGVPALAPATLRELADHRVALARRISSDPVEIIDEEPAEAEPTEVVD